MHDRAEASLLSGTFSDEKAKEGSMNGIMNLLAILLFITNVKSILTSLQHHGFVAKDAYKDFRARGE